MKKRLRGNLGWLVSGLLIGLSFSGVAVARIIIPPHSVSEKNLTKGLRKRINQAAAVGPEGVKGDKGDPGPQGASGLPGQAESSEPPSEVAVSTVTATSAILETTMGPVDGDGILYQFQLARSSDELRSEVSCPESSVPEVQCLGALASSGEEGFIRQPGDLPTESLLPEDGQRRIRLQINGLSPATEYHYRLLVVDRFQTVDTIEWYAPPRIGPTRSFETAAGWTCPSGGC